MSRLSIGYRGAAGVFVANDLMARGGVGFCANRGPGEPGRTATLPWGAGRVQGPGWSGATP